MNHPKVNMGAQPYIPMMLKKSPRNSVVTSENGMSSRDLSNTQPQMQAKMS